MAEGETAAVAAVEEGKDAVLATEIIRRLMNKGIKLIALDFDLTIVDIHTAGVWRGPSTKLAPHVRPCFKALIEAALLEPNLHVCIVTYSSQPGLIEDVLKVAIPDSDTSRIVIRAVSRDWAPQKSEKNAGSGGTGASHSRFLGKEEHIARVTTDLYNLRRAIIQTQEILLMDDDIENIETARKFGHIAFEVKEDVSLEEIAAFAENFTEETELPRGVTVLPNKPVATNSQSDPSAVATECSSQASAIPSIAEGGLSNPAFAANQRSTSSHTVSDAECPQNTSPRRTNSIHLLEADGNFYAI